MALKTNIGNYRIIVLLNLLQLQCFYPNKIFAAVLADMTDVFLGYPYSEKKNQYFYNTTYILNMPALLSLGAGLFI